MKYTRRIMGVLLALMMVMGLMTATALAAEDGPVITVPDDGHTYEVYQIFTATLAEKDGKVILSDVKWGQNGTGTQGELVAQTTLDELAALATSNDNETKLDVITKYVNLGEGSSPVATLTKDNLTATVVPGYYLIKDKENTVSGNDAYTTYIVEIVDDVTVTRKAGVPEVDKVIVEGEKMVEENEVSIDDTITYKFTGTLPTNIADYNEYFYKFTDTMSAGLDFVGNLKVEVEGVDVTKYFWAKATINTDEETGKKASTTLVVAIQDLLDLENASEFAGKDITASTKVVVIYDAKLNENAVVGNNGNKNDVDLEYDNNPNDDGEGDTTPPEEPKEEPTTTKPTGKTPKDEVWTYTTEVTIEKVDQDGKVLTGAEFTITGAGVNMVVTKGDAFVKCDATDCAESHYWLLNDGTYTDVAPTTEGIETSVYTDQHTKYHKETKVIITGVANGEDANRSVKAFVGADGKVTFIGLGVGTYTITESVVPAGYNSIPEFTVTIGWDDSTDDADNCTWTYNWSNNTEETDNTIQIKNQAGSTLPETGGMGTTLFYIVGGLLVAAAVVLLVTKRRMGAAE